MARGGSELLLRGGERVILHQQGGYLSSRSWKLGHFYLTSERLLFRQVKRLILDISLEDVTAVAFRKRPFILATKTCIVLFYRDSASGQPREATIITPHLHSWCEKLAELLSRRGVELPVQSTLTESGTAKNRRDRVKEILAKVHGDLPERIEEEHLAKVAQPLDPASGEIIWYLWENRHAKIEELRQLLGESSHMNVLTRIKEVVNPMARKMLGRPLLVFERSRIDHITGQTVLHSWWLCKEAERRQAQERRSVDILDEGDHVTVILELADVREEDIQLEVVGERLIVEVDGPDRRHREEVSLPSTVDAERFAARYHNSLLQVRFEKALNAELRARGSRAL